MAEPTEQVTPSTVAVHIEALNLTGLSFAVRRLLGRDPQPVTGQFTMWARQDLQGLPAVTRAYWAALAPLNIGRPQSPAAAVCDQVLKGRERDGTVALKAAADCADAGKACFRPLPHHTGDATADALRRKALVKAVKDYWRALGTMYGEVRGAVVAGDLQTAVEQIRRAEQTLREVVEQVAVLAQGVAGQEVQDTAPVQDLQPSEPVSSEARAVATVAGADTPYGLASEEDPDGGVATYVEEPTEDAVMARAEAFAQRRVREEPPTPQRPVEVLSTRPVRNHIFLPVLFVMAVAGLALYVIFAVLNAPNPLAQ
ncbi:MAG TPA: hypothetical protein VMM13_20215 [Euzebya sp.]|nr:hypothetical protein [Euzebya sp.]